MAVKFLKKINTKLQFSYRQNEFLNPKLCKLLCNSSIQLYFSYSCISRYPLVGLKIKKKTFSKQMYPFFLKRNTRHHIGAKELKVE